METMEIYHVRDKDLEKKKRGMEEEGWIETSSCCIPKTKSTSFWLYPTGLESCFSSSFSEATSTSFIKRARVSTSRIHFILRLDGFCFCVSSFFLIMLPFPFYRTTKQTNEGRNYHPHFLRESWSLPITMEIRQKFEKKIANKPQDLESYQGAPDQARWGELHAQDKLVHLLLITAEENKKRKKWSNWWSQAFLIKGIIS